MKTRLVVCVYPRGGSSRRKYFQKDELDEHLAGLLLQTYIARSHVSGWWTSINLAHIPGNENRLVSGEIEHTAIFLLKKFQAPFFQVDLDCELNSDAEFSEAIKALQEEGWTPKKQ